MLPNLIISRRRRKRTDFCEITGLNAGVIAAFTAGAFYVVGNLTDVVNASPIGSHTQPDFGSPAYAFNIAGHALVGCASAEASGGKCGPAPLAGGVTSAAGPFVNKLDFAPALVANSVVGGAAAVAGGGKFENGAITGAFGYLFNSEGGRVLSSFFRGIPGVGFILDLVFSPPAGTNSGWVNADGIAKIEQHLSRLDALDWGPNQEMISRLQQGYSTPQDLNFYNHELIEADLLNQGLDARDAHLETLRQQGIPYEPGYERQLYAPSVIRQYPDHFNPANHQ